MEQVNDYLISLNTPRNFDYSDPENDIKNIRQAFARSCAALEEMGVKDPHRLTVYDFNAKTDYFEKKYKPKMK